MTIIPQNFYVYTLKRPAKPDAPPEIIQPDGTVIFYVGKGRNGRIKNHELCARKHEMCRHVPCRVIRKVWQEGGQITKEKICEDVSEQSAFRVEKYMIAYGRICNWPIVNLSNGGDTGPTGYRWTPEQIEVRRRLATEQMQDPIQRARIGNMLRGRPLTPEENEAFHQKLKDLYASNPELIERQRQISQNYWAEHPAYYKTGFRDPNGKVYEAETIPNLSAFCREHGLDRPNMIKLTHGTIHTHHGWTLYDPPKQDQSITHHQQTLFDL